MSTIAVIGAGRWGRNIIRTLSELECEVSIADNDSSGVHEMLRLEYPRITITTDYRELLHDPLITHVCIATPISTHADIARNALTAGKHVFVEKPLSLDKVTIDELYDLAQSKNLTLFTGYIYTYDQAFLALKNELRNIDSFAIETIWTKYGTFNSLLSENLLVHELALCYELLGSLEPKEISRNEENIFEGTFESARGTAHIFIDREQQEKKKVFTVCTDSSLYTLTIGNLAVQDINSKEEKVLYKSSAQLLEIELQSFLDETKNGALTNSKRRSTDFSIAAVLQKATNSLAETPAPSALL